MSKDTKDEKGSKDAKDEKDVEETPVEDTAPRPPIGNYVENPDPLLGRFVKLTAGDYAGEHGTYVSVNERDKDGNPTSVLVKLRDPALDAEYVVAGHDEIEETTYLGGR